eukprot:6064211-Prorocentrum_lima.AAC.1
MVIVSRRPLKISTAACKLSGGEASQAASRRAPYVFNGTKSSRLKALRECVVCVRVICAKTG